MKKDILKQNNNNISQYLETNKSCIFLINLYSFIFIQYSKNINISKYFENKTISKNSNKLVNNTYFIYNSIYFTKNKIRKSKFSLFEFLSTKYIKNGHINSFNKTNKKIGFGKLTWYWIFKTMLYNRFFLNYKQYRNFLSVKKYNLFEVSIKNYEKNYNNWLFWANKTSEHIQLPFFQKTSRRLFKLYKKYLSSEKIKIIQIKKLKRRFNIPLPKKSFKYYRKMKFRFKKKIRKRKRKTKLWSASKIRFYRKRSKQLEIWEPKRQERFIPLLYKKNIRIYKNVKYWEKMVNRGSWKLKQSKNSYYSTISLSFVRINNLTSIYERNNPSIIRSYTHKTNKNKKNLLNFKYKFPKHSLELNYGYNYFNTFINNNKIKFVNSKNFVEFKKKTKNLMFKKNLITNFGLKVVNFSKMFKDSNILNKKIKNNYKLANNYIKFLPIIKKKYKIFNCEKNIKKNIKNMHKPKCIVQSTYSYSNNLISNTLPFFIKNKKKKLFNKVKILFYYKSNILIKNLIKSLSVQYLNNRFLINKIRIDQIISNIFLSNGRSVEIYNRMVKFKNKKNSRILYSGLPHLNSIYIKNSEKLLNLNYKSWKKSRIVKKKKKEGYFWKKKSFLKYGKYSNFFKKKYLKKNIIFKKIKTYAKVFKASIGSTSTNTLSWSVPYSAYYVPWVKDTKLKKKINMHEMYKKKRFFFRWKKKSFGKLKYSIITYKKFGITSEKEFKMLDKNIKKDSLKINSLRLNNNLFFNTLIYKSLFKTNFNNKIKKIKNKKKAYIIKKKYKLLKKKFKFFKKRLARKKFKMLIFLKKKKIKKNYFFFYIYSKNRYKKKRKDAKRIFFANKNYTNFKKLFLKNYYTNNLSNEKLLNNDRCYLINKFYSNSIISKKNNWFVSKYEIEKNFIYNCGKFSLKNIFRSYRYNKFKYKLYIESYKNITFRCRKKINKKLLIKKNYKKTNINFKKLNLFSYLFFNKKLKYKYENMLILKSYKYFDNENFLKKNLKNYYKFNLNYYDIQLLKIKKWKKNKTNSILGINFFNNNYKCYFNLNPSSFKFIKSINIIRNSNINLDNTKSYLISLNNLAFKRKSLRKLLKKTKIKKKLNYQIFTFFCRFNVFPLFKSRKKNINKKFLKTFLKSNSLKLYRLTKLFNMKTNKLYRIKNVESSLKVLFKNNKLPIKYNSNTHLKYRYASIYKKKKKSKKRIKLKKKKFIRLFKKNFIWKKLKKKVYRKKKGWLWKNFFFKNNKLLKREKNIIYKKIINNISGVISKNLKEFIGTKLINKLKKRSIKKNIMFWSKNRFCLWRSKIFSLNAYFWSKFRISYTKHYKGFSYLYSIPRNEKRKYFFKREVYLWKFKNLFYLRKHKQFANRFYPKKWYKVKRKKFPLKRHLKDWSLKLAKMSIFKYNGITFPSIYTFFDSSSVYYKNLSSYVKPKKYWNSSKIKNEYINQDIDRDLEIFSDEIKNPKFSKFSGKKQIFSSWKSRQVFKIIKKKLPEYGSSAPSLYTRSVTSIKTKEIESAEKAFFKKYSKKQSVLIKKRLDSFILSLDIIVSKIKLINPKNEIGYCLKTIFETKNIKDSFSTRINYYENSYNKYGVILKNLIYSKQVSNNSLVKSFSFVNSISYKLINYSLKATGRDLSVTIFHRKNSLQKYRNSLLYIFTSRYRYPTYEVKHNFQNSSKYYKNVNSLIGYKRSILLIGRFYNNAIITKEEFKKIDFLKKNNVNCQFRHKISNFYKKNMWIFSSFDSVNTNYLIKSII